MIPKKIYEQAGLTPGDFSRSSIRRKDHLHAEGADRQGQARLTQQRCAGELIRIDAPHPSPQSSRAHSRIRVLAFGTVRRRPS
jgi:hypothetical protein